MSRSAAPATALLAALSILTACGGDSERVDAATTSTPTSMLTVTCTNTGTAADQSKVSAGPAGLQVRVVDESDSGLVLMMESESSGKVAYVESDDETVEVAPEAYAVRCVDLDEPEHMEAAVGNPESQRVEVGARAQVWTPQRDLSCDQRVSAIRDYAALAEPDPALRSEPVEPVVRGDRDMGRLLLDDDELVTTGYVDGVDRRVEVVRRGDVVGVVDLSLGPEGWFITGSDSCASL